MEWKISLWQLVMFCAVSGLWGYILGHNYATMQWVNCGRKKLTMRIRGKYLFNVNYLGEE